MSALLTVYFKFKIQLATGFVSLSKSKNEEVPRLVACR